MPLTPNLIAGADIYPRRFLMIDPANAYNAIQATASAPIIGVSAESTRIPQTPDHTESIVHASAGENVSLYGAQETCLVELGANISSPGTQLTATSAGLAIGASTAAPFVGGYALQGGVTGDYIKIVVTPMAQFTS